LNNAEILAGTPYASYAYGYPHKTAYRPFDPPRPLAEVWAEEPREALFLYAHVPFCEQRCGFCNLFTTAWAGPDLPGLYLEALARQARQVRAALGEARFARVAIGGGTPTFLSVDQLRRMLAILTDEMGADLRQASGSVEASPATADPEKLALLRESGFTRLSLGVQTFDERESKALGRTQRRNAVEQAIGHVRDAGFSTLNLDLIYGGEGQSPESWVAAVREALVWQPEEIYLYPLYVRPLTGLGRRSRAWDDQRLAAYRAGRDLLLTAGYRQVSMRMFRRGDAPREEGPVYCCQADGMVGLGCGARSYTRELHYSTEYAVGRTGVRAILEDFVRREEDRFSLADYGFALDMEEQRRRFVLLALLQCEGLDLDQYQERFGGDPGDDLPELEGLEPLGLARRDGRRLLLTATGMERSDAIGPWLNSIRVRSLMESYDLR
jgi:oxygen-independent coproporphyrinogen-3 oxidase